MPLTEEQQIRMVGLIHEAFTPTAPIQSRDLFAGRRSQIQRIVGVILQRGEHAILYGERGVGKTSLVNTLFDLLVLTGKSNYQTTRVQCASGMDFEAIWRGALRKLVTKDDQNEEIELDHMLEGEVNSSAVLHAFEFMTAPCIVIIDEVDRITDSKTKTALADTIKTLSDNSVPATLILVGVADSVDELVAEHLSIVRNLKEIRLPRMSPPELLEIIDKGLTHCAGLSMDPHVRERIADYSQGLPEYTHRLSQVAALNVVNDGGRTYIMMSDLDTAIRECVDNHLETNFAAYKKATDAPRGIRYKPVLLACALAKKDELGFFYARDVVDPLSLIGSVDSAIPAFAKHLKQFSEESRGPILQRRGRQYRFCRPDIEPYIILRGLSDGIISESQLSHPSKRSSTEPGQLSLLSSYDGPMIEL